MQTETEFPRVSFSACWSEKLAAAIAGRAGESYPIEMHSHSADFAALESAINQGIDSHLEAVFFSQFQGAHGRIGLDIEGESLAVLVRRLLESGDEDAESLASGICETLNIELI